MLCTQSICYTSGTTGNPKGAMLTHLNLTAACCANQGDLPIYTTDVHCSYLPLAHIFERILQVMYFAKGASVGFYTGDVINLLPDLQELKPTIFPSVPRLFNRYIYNIYIYMYILFMEHSIVHIYHIYITYNYACILYIYLHLYKYTI
jgi:long-subunit acyl-CoA synthetase (AMP-forming)